MTPHIKREPITKHNKVFLAGRIVRVTWIESDEPEGDFEIIFASDGWLRMRPVGGKDEEEFLTPVCNVWRIYNVKARA
jgi:hypothetical protein